MKRLWPSIDAIARKLFEPSDLLIQKWVEDSSCLDKDLVANLEKNELACEKRQDFLSAITEVESKSSEHPQIVPQKMPDELFSILNRRRSVSNMIFSDDPRPGQIRLIETLVYSDGITEIDLATPLAVLLYEPTEVPGLWYGYGVASETAYAGYWDFVLEDGFDTPFDPMAGMIQVWNPVNIVLSTSTTRVLAELGDMRMRALEYLVNEYRYGVDTDPKDAYPGTLAIRWIDDHRILTGSPIGGVEDPRLRYQQLYHARFETVRASAAEQLYEAEDPKMGEGEANLTHLIDQVTKNISKWAEEFRHSWVAEPSIPFAMTAGPNDPSGAKEYRYKLNDRLIVSFVLRPIDQSSIVEVHLLLKGEGSLRVIPSEDDLELPGHLLSATSPKAFFAFSFASHNKITIEDDESSIEIPITVISKS